MVGSGIVIVVQVEYSSIGGRWLPNWVEKQVVTYLKRLVDQRKHLSRLKP